MADDDQPETEPQTTKQGAEQAKALNSVTDNVRSVQTVKVYPLVCDAPQIRS